MFDLKHTAKTCFATILFTVFLCQAFVVSASEEDASTAPAVESPSQLDTTFESAVHPSNINAEEALPTIEMRSPLANIRTIDLTVPPDDIWQRIRHGFAMPNIDNDLVAHWREWYTARPDYLQRVGERGQRYLYHIVSELEKRGMPMELALLPIVESAYNPMALSSSRAAGLWQFIPSTGRSYNLEQNWWVDQRRDIVASTSAALGYLQQIYDMHGDWLLALASYNWGENAVARAIAKNQANGLPTDYLSLDMPAETRNYVPKLQAIKEIIAHPEKFGIALAPVPNKPYFVTVEKPADMDIALAAKLAEMPVTEFIALNPAYKRPVMRGKEKTFIVLPAEKEEIFQENLEEHNAPLTHWRAYTLKKGENLVRVAKRFGTTTAKLQKVNDITTKMRIRPGHTLLVPSKPDTTVDANLAAVNLPVATTVKRHSRQTRKVVRARSQRSSKVVTHRQSAKKKVATKPRKRSKAVAKRNAKNRVQSIATQHDQSRS